MPRLIGVVLAAALASCSAPAEPRGPAFSNEERQAFFATLQKEMPQTLEGVTCKCCNKSLGQCYRERADPAGHRCSPACANCYSEGKAVQKLKREGKTDPEIAREIALHDQVGPVR